MATEISARGRPRAIGQEEYNLYSSLSEDELVQMAIEQSLADKTRGPATTETTVPTRVNREPAHFYPWTRSAVSPESAPTSAPRGLFQEVMQKYNRSKSSQLAIVQMLLPVTSRTRVRRSGISPLHLAAERNNDEVLEALLGARFDVNAPLAPERARLYEDRRSSALYFAVVNNNVYATELLLLAGADPNRDVINPLLVAIRHGCLRTMQLLLDHGANIDAYIATHPTSFPATIMFAMKCLSLLKFLMDLGCDGEPCFSCLYGNGPHPPAPPPSNRFNDAPASDKAPSAVQDELAEAVLLILGTPALVCVLFQFCEFLSAPEVSRWAGPIIDVLLDYVGNVQLCSRLKEHIDSFEDWAVIKEKAEPPRPLAHLCRLRVRKAIGKYRIKLLDTLPLPGRLIRYLKYENTQ
ncbi:hypothetical protein K5549_009904 [Capra hircus]|nr:hypothetical protein K5549_009904 [Capra hircus]